MKNIHRSAATIVAASFATLLTGCATDVDPKGELTGEQSAALEAAVGDLDPHRDALPIADEELRELGRVNVLAALHDASCEHRGVVSGIWFDEDLQAAFDGSWFEVGTAALGGSVQGRYDDGLYAGVVDGPDLSGDVDGAYADGLFHGAWSATMDDTGAVHDGELIGRYERRNQYGGYFFGVWTDCGPRASVDSAE